MTSSAPRRRRSGPPARQLRLLADLAPGATVVFVLVSAWLAVTTVQNLAQPMSATVVLALVLGTLCAVLSGLVAYRLGVEVPRVLRSWEIALAERTQVLRDE